MISMSRMGMQMSAVMAFGGMMAGQMNGGVQGQSGTQKESFVICPKCGSEMKKGLKFCSECGKPKPQREEWICSCGAVNTGKFCSECGSPRPTGKWTCSCGAVNTGKFCAECGKPRQ